MLLTIASTQSPRIYGYNVTQRRVYQMNMGAMDRIIRAIVGIVALVLALWVVTGGWQIALWVVSGIMLVTAAIGFCPLYVPLHISTKKKV